MQQIVWTFLLFWSILLTTRAGVTCVWSSGCVLPCSSQYHEIIHWYKDGKKNSVHTFYDKADHLDYQDADYKGRTSLFQDQVPQGNASLLLSSIRTTDEGRYKCYTATSSDNREQFIQLSVRAPVKNVDLKLKSGEISCSVEGVYPEPKISWSEDGSPVENFSKEPLRDKDGLFSVSSVFTQSVKENTTYTCSISLVDESQKYTTSLRPENVAISSGQDATIHCPASQENSGDSTITLTFGDSSTILNISQISQLPKDIEWKGEKIQLTPDGTVTIYNLENQEHTGTYRCVRASARSRQEVLTQVQIKSDHTKTGVVVGVVVTVFIVVVICIIVVICWVKKGTKHRKNQTDSSGNNTNSSNGNPNEQEQDIMLSTTDRSSP
ncbi:hypothetical protein KOW79_018531 [Hemibagrus wyckioides]|uniref:Ig-like domain-containing protein n=1 Tax=Hemibagrus wyckioides TaxID=337641 RepID=A0A9D3SAK8_9TELE|nr:hypothetical protein KOW79_018531 [Hemibagrus wyckioides]